MISMNGTTVTVTGGVDTHKDTHTAAALDSSGRLLGTVTFPASQSGYVELLDWLRTFGTVERVGVEGTGSYGSGLATHLRAEGVTVLEVNRPSRQARRRNGKSDTADAEAAARATLAGVATAVPKQHSGVVEAIRLLRLERRSAIVSRTKTANQLHAVVATAPEPLRGTLRKHALPRLVERSSKFSKAAVTDIETATKRVLRGLARRWQLLSREIDELDKELASLVAVAAPELVALRGVGVDVAGTLLVAAGDNPERLDTEASFAALCGASPVDASSGRQHRHRLNRGGNRDANRALWVVTLVRSRIDPRTIAYVQRRTQEGLSRLEIFRCLKRYIARDIFKILRTLRPDFAPASLVLQTA